MNKDEFRQSLIDSGKFLSVGKKFRDAVQDNPDRRSDLGAVLYRIVVIEEAGGRTKMGNVFCTVLDEGTPQEAVYFEERDLEQLEFLPKKPKKPDTAYQNAVNVYLEGQSFVVFQIKNINPESGFAEARVLVSPTPDQGVWSDVVVYGPVNALTHLVISG